ncbi:type VI secretion system ATPase TssH [Burkholderia pyrrocinia]|uniref:type VI secretion system ATPase TssH n=1 Tax=Burkholderia pyrrocinia TaxID=60550 RepID=UPI001BCFAF02|nr:type VI secretion system ATPase TssH [Burkholderia pyrrocinia]QVN23412.1 type VI secretion system ATPase TssH [Burkholderia pyrrocinia]
MGVSRQALFGKLNVTLFKGIESATAFCKLRGNPYVEVVHWLHQILQLTDSDLHRVIRHCDIDPAVVERDVERALASLPSGASSISDFSHHIENSIERAWLYATLVFGEQRVRGAWWLAALVTTPELRRILIDISPQFQKIRPDGLFDMLPAIIADSPEKNAAVYDGSDLAPATPGEASGALVGTSAGGSALGRYCADLTQQARDGRIDPVVGREHEIRTMIDILLRRRQNNPLLTGEAGVGKTAVVEGLAVAIANGNVPPSLSGVRLLSLDVGALLAGASMKGEFESRLKAVLEEATQSPQPVILFVDEVHTLVGAGGQAGTGDAANLLKPALARGTLRTIGATTWSEYKRHIEKDPALTRRFQVLQVMEPEEAAAVDMVRGLVETFGAHHDVTILDEAVRAAVRLSHRYIPARQLPDKAISLLDTACARVALSQHAPPGRVAHLRERLACLQTERALLVKEAAIGEDRRARLGEVDVQLARCSDELLSAENRWQDERRLTDHLLALRLAMVDREAKTEVGEPVSDAASTLDEIRALEIELRELQQDAPLVRAQVDEAAVAGIVSDWTGIPVGRMVGDEIGAVLGLADQLAARVIGQQHALVQIADRIHTARAQLTDPNKPIGVFMLVGPSGVGKTETALSLADALYGGEHNLITINMSEYQEAHTVSSLKGAPPGYVGYGEGGVLTEAVRRRPYSVVLLDEIEKAHPDVHEVFYQVFDKGWMEDGEGRQIDFRNTTLLLTSNVGSELIAQLCDDPALAPEPAVLRDALLPELRKVFPAAFVGRLAIVPYLPLGPDILRSLVGMQFERVRERMREQHGIALHYEDAVVSHVIERCPVAETGARLLIAFIEQHVLPVLSRLWLAALADKKKLDSIRLELENGEIAYRAHYA